MNASEIKFLGEYKFAGSKLLGLPAATVKVVERRTPSLFSVLFPDGSRETVAASDLSG